MMSAVTVSSPSSPGGSAWPSRPTAAIAAEGNGRPALAKMSRARPFPLSRQSPLVVAVNGATPSVIPHASTYRSPATSTRSSTCDRGTGEPEWMTDSSERRICGRRRSSAANWGMYGVGA